MEKPVTIAARNVELPEPVESLLRDRAAGLERFYPRLVGCAVTVEGPGERHRKGGPYEVRIDMRVPDREPVMVTRQSKDNLMIAVKESFDAAERRLEDLARLQRGATKAHEEGIPRARVARLFPEEGYGFLETPEGREVYFHRNAVVQGRYEDLLPGDEVAFREEVGDQGPQASAVLVSG